MSRRSLVGIAVLALLPLLLGISGGSPSTLGYRFDRASAPYVEPVLGWMVANSASKILDSGEGSNSTIADVEQYLDLANRSARLSRASWDSAASGPARSAALSADLLPLRSELDSSRPKAERHIQDEVSAALLRSGLSHSLAGREVVFPPVLFRFESLPYLLVVSPRDRIQRATTVLLRPRLTLEEAEELENQVWGSGYAGIVLPIGGLGVYPSMVPESSDYRWVLTTVAHEWTHQFLALRPLGWRYAFGAEGDNRMVMINETVAEIVGKEIGNAVFEGERPAAMAEQRRSSGGSAATLDARKALSDIRKQVDRLLDRGEIDEAESFMENSRQTLVQQGYQLRKLNQAYFAFHGNYTEASASVGGAQGDDVASRLRALRKASPSLGDFAWRVSEAGSYQEFLRIAPAP